VQLVQHVSNHTSVFEFSAKIYIIMYAWLTNACHKKCIAPKYRDADLQKGESVCIDRCVAKYLDVHQRIGDKLTQITMRDQEFQQNVAGKS